MHALSRKSRKPLLCIFSYDKTQFYLITFRLNISGKQFFFTNFICILFYKVNNDEWTTNLPSTLCHLNFTVAHWSQATCIIVSHLLQSGLGSLEATAALLSQVSGGGEGPLLHHLEELARKDQEVSQLRREKRQLETTMREVQMAAIVRQQAQQDAIEALEEEAERWVCEKGTEW